MGESASKPDVKPQSALTAEKAAALLKADLKNLDRKVKAGKPLSSSERNLLQSTLGGGKPSEKTYADNQSELADILGVGRKTIQRHAKKEGSPGTAPDGRYNVQSWRTWLRDNSTADGAVDPDRAALQDERLALQNKKLAYEVSILAKEYIPVADVEVWVAEMIGAAKKKLLSGPSSLAPQVVGMTVPEAEALIKEWIREALSHLHKNPGGTSE